MKSSKWALSFMLKRQCQMQVKNYSKVVRQQDPEEINSMPVMQYATENSKKKKRVYMWGNAMFGALGNANFIKPVNHKYALEDMRKPWRLKFADLHEVKNNLNNFYSITLNIYSIIFIIFK